MSDVVKVVADAANSSEFTIKDCMYTIGACISVVSAIVALVSARWTFKRDLNTLGDSEIKIFELISKAESELFKFNVRLKEKKESEGDKFILKGSYEAELNCLSENLLNVYDIACQRYLDKKLDKKRFEKTYKLRIGKLFSNSLYRQYLYENNYQYSALKMVNKALNNPEQ